MDARTFLLISVAAGAWGCGAHVAPPPATASAPAVEKPVAVHPSSTAPMMPVPPEMEKQRQAVLERVDADFQQHEAEAKDPMWSDKASSELRADLEQIRQGRTFSLLDVDCRAHSCKAVLEWPSYTMASADASELVHHYYQVNCGRTVLMPEPAEREQPYRLRILFKCS
jgi:hypothetical protein